MADAPLNEAESQSWLKKKVEFIKDYNNVQKEILSGLKTQSGLDEKISKQVQTRLWVEQQLQAVQNGLLKGSKEFVKNTEKEIAEKSKLIDKAIKSRDAIGQNVEHLQKMSFQSHGLIGDFSKLLVSVKNLPDLSKQFNLSEMLSKFRMGQYWGELLEKSVGKIGPELTLVGHVLGQSLKLFAQWDSTMTGLRYQFGFVRGQEKEIYKTARDIAVEYASMGVSLEVAIGTLSTMGKYFGGIWNYSKQVATTVSLIQSQLGISADTTLKVMQNLAALGGGLIESQQNTVLWSKQLANAAGVEWSGVMSDVASMNSTTLAMMGKMPSQILRTAVALRKMGTDINSSAQASRQLLNFSENINDEMNASVLLGRSINLQRARELAYAGDIEGSTAEIIRLGKQNNFLGGMDVLQKEAFAQATGRSVEELTSMLQTEKQLTNVRLHGTQQQKEQLKLYNDLRTQNQALRKDTADRVLQGLKEKSNQEYLTAISDKWHGIMVSIESVIYPIVSGILSIVPVMIDIAKYSMTWYLLLGKLGGQATKIGSIFATVGEGIGSIFATVGEGIAKLGFLGKILGMVGKIGIFFAKWLEPIGWVILATQVIYGAIKGWNNTTGSWLEKLGGGLMGIFRAVIPGFDYIVGAIKWVASWTMKVGTFLFKWMTPIGLTIQAFEGLKKLFPETFSAVGNLIGKIWNAFKSILSLEVDVAKFLFKWVVPLGFVWTTIKNIGSAIKETFSSGIGMIGSFFNLIGTQFRYIKSVFTHTITGWIHDLDHFMASLVNGISHIGTLVVNALIYPFKAAWNWVKSLWGGNSPSQVGLSIVKGLESVGGLLFDSLTAPFKRGWSFITSLFGRGTKNIVSSVPKEKTMVPASVKEKAMENKSPALFKQPTEVKAGMTVPAVHISPIPIASPEPAKAITKATSKTEKPMETTNDKLDVLIKEICGLRADLNSGKVRSGDISMDGQKVSSYLARTLDFKGAFGANKA